MQQGQQREQEKQGQKQEQEQEQQEQEHLGTFAYYDIERLRYTDRYLCVCVSVCLRRISHSSHSKSLGKNFIISSSCFEPRPYCGYGSLCLGPFGSLGGFYRLSCVDLNGFLLFSFFFKK